MATAQQKLDIFIQWMKDNDITYNTNLIEIRVGVRGSGHGYGVVALHDITSDQKDVGRIPKSAVLSCRNTQIADIISDEMLAGIPAASLSVMYEKFLGEKSRWYGYLQCLPDFEPIPCYWSEKEQACLQGTSIEDLVKSDKEFIADDYNTLIAPVLEKYPDRLPKEFFTFENFMKVSTLVASRAFDVDEYHGQSMVPLADMFNHKTAAENVHFESNGDVCPVCGKGSGTCGHEVDVDEEEFDLFTGEGGDSEGEEEGEDAAGEGHGGCSSCDSEGEGKEKAKEGSDKAEQSNEDNENSDDVLPGEKKVDGSSKRKREDGEDVDEESSTKVQKTENSTTDPTVTDDSKIDDDNMMEMVIVRPCKKGDEVFNTFGELPNMLLLSKYGFAEPENPFDVVNLPLKLVEKICTRHFGAKITKEVIGLCEELDLFELQLFTAKFDGTIGEFLPKFLYMFLVPDSTRKAWKKSPEKAATQILNKKPEEIEKIPKFAQAVCDILKERSAFYPPPETTTTTSEDNNKEPKEFLQWAAVLKDCEIKILDRTLQYYTNIVNTTPVPTPTPAPQGNGGESSNKTTKKSTGGQKKASKK